MPPRSSAKQPNLTAADLALHPIPSAPLTCFVGRSEPGERVAMITLTFPDGAARQYRGRHHRPRDRRRHRQVARQAHRRHGARRHGGRPCRSDRQGRQDRVPHPRRSARAGADPARCRARAGRGRAGALSRHAGDHRPGDRERLLLRLRPQRALHAGGFRRHRGEDARDHRARTSRSPRRSGRARRPSRCSPTRARPTSSSSSTRSPKARTSRSMRRATGSISAAART